MNANLKLSFHLTSFSHNMTATGETVTYRAGDVIRHQGHIRTVETLDAFSDCIILGFSEPNVHGDVFVKLARPFCYATCVGTTGPSVVTGVEKIEMPITTLTSEKVVSHRPYISGSIMSGIESAYGETN